MAEATNQEVINWADKSVDERTPRKFRAKPPDVTVIVGGVKFFHYGVALSSNCGFFDNLLASQMRESKTATIEFPDREPSEWMEVYRILDPTNYIGLGQSPSSLITCSKAEILLPWLDYLGMEPQLAACDSVLSKHSKQNHPSYGTWEQLKDFPCLPKTKQAIVAQVKRLAHKVIKDVAVHKEGFEDLKCFLLDPECGDELWSYFISSVVDLPKDMINDLDRHTIVSSVLFGYMVSRYCRPVHPKKKSFLDSSSDEDSDDDIYVPRRRAPAPAPAPRRRAFLDSDSDDDSDSS